jgi:hypothetical protein
LQLEAALTQVESRSPAWSIEPVMALVAVSMQEMLL